MIVKTLVTQYVWSSSSRTWASGSDVIDAYDVVCNQSLGEMNDTFSFKIPNVRGARDGDFNSQDRIEIHLLLNGASTASSNLIFNGLIKTVTEDITETSKVLRVEGKSFGEIATNAITFAARPAVSNVTAMSFINAAARSVELFDSDFGITAYDIPTLKKDGVTSFPVINGGAKVTEFNRSLNSVLNKYCSNEYTEDGNYFWYIDNQRILHVKPRLTNDLVKVFVEGSDFKTARIRRDDSKVKNYVIVKAGNSPKGSPISTYADDVVSRAKYGFKYYMLVDVGITDRIISKELGAYRNGQEPLAYPITTSDGTVITDLDDWDDYVKAKALIEAGKAGDTYILNHQSGLLEITIVTPPTSEYSVGDYVQVTSPSYGLTNYPMRIKEINWNVEDTTLTLVEEVTI